MPTCRDIINYVFEIAPNPAWRSERQTENVIQFGDPQGEATGVATCWWATLDILKLCRQRKLNLVFTHEDGFFADFGGTLWAPSSGPMMAKPVNIARLKVMVEGNMVVQRVHSNVDIAPWGMPTQVAERIAMPGSKVAQKVGYIPVLEFPPLSLAEFIEHLKKSLSIPFVRYTGSLDRTVRRVAICWGGLGQNWASIDSSTLAGVDTVITGDMMDGVARFGIEADIAVVDCFHHVLEMDGMKALGDKLRSKFPPLPVEFLPNSFPWQIG